MSKKQQGGSSKEKKKYESAWMQQHYDQLEEFSLKYKKQKDQEKRKAQALLSSQPSQQPNVQRRTLSELLEGKERQKMSSEGGRPHSQILDAPNIEQLPKQPQNEELSSSPAPQVFSSNHKRMLVIIDHLINKSEDQALRSRMKKAMHDLIQQKTTIMSFMNQADPDDFSLLINHRLFTQSFEEAIFIYTDLEVFLPYRKLDFFKLFRSIYRQISETIGFQKIAEGLSHEFPLLLQPPICDQKATNFIDLCLQQIKSSYQNKMNEFRRVQKKMTRANPTERQEVVQMQQVQQVGQVEQREKEEHEPRLRTYDGSSEYGIFKSITEQGRMASEGVYKYRLHRTISFLDRHSFIQPHQNLKLARDIAAFIIKLTDLHLAKIVGAALINAKVSAQRKVPEGYQGAKDEVTYFAKGKYQPQSQPNSTCGNVRVHQYPPLMKKYMKLRAYQLYRQNFLYLRLYPELYPTLAQARGQEHPQQYTINEYYFSAAIPEELRDQYRSYCEPKAKSGRVRVEPKHITAVVANHSYYSSTLISFRLKTLF